MRYLVEAPIAAAQQCLGHLIRSRAGELGLFCTNLSREYGGSGADRVYSAIQLEALSCAGAPGLGVPVHPDIVANYIHDCTSEELKQPRLACGVTVATVAMTEPDTGSDLQAVKTRWVAWA